ncbi:MAG TPA: class I SAM-dependent methyltransferase, partial [Acidimicrobiales bacterium]|nr:class I SAM-dependent methyltransferase [Acidimicrobiales bacterium]
MSAPGDRADHWDATYTERGAEDVSWFQSEPHTSLALFDALGVRRDAAVIDVGGGASALVDRLVTHGYVDLTVLDISPVALDLARDRVGDAAKVEWAVSDVLTWAPDRLTHSPTSQPAAVRARSAADAYGAPDAPVTPRKIRFTTGNGRASRLPAVPGSREG